jgi:hypothetical protein
MARAARLIEVALIRIEKPHERIRPLTERSLDVGVKRTIAPLR